MKSLPMCVYRHTTPNPGDFPLGSVEHKTAKAELNKALDELSALYWEHSRDAKQFLQSSIRTAIIMVIGTVILFVWAYF